MEYIPVKTRIVQPPKDDLFQLFDEYLSAVRAGDVIAVSSKIVSICEGNCVPYGEDLRKVMVRQQADHVIERDYWYSPLTITNSAFIGTAGIDKSNANGYLVSLPKDSFNSAKEIHSYVQNRFGIENVGVIVTDSHSTPLRRGAMGVAIGWWGFEPTVDHVGEADLFGQPIKVEVANIVDGLAAGATVVMGETNQCQPIVIIRGTPDLVFTDQCTKDNLFVPPGEDTFRVLYEKFLPSGDS